MKKLFLFFCTLWVFSPAYTQETDYGHWEMADSMNIVTRGASTVLQSGKVLVAGEGGASELYDYSVDTWAVTDSLATKRKGRRLLTLQDGRALAMSGTINEIFDETTKKWTASAPFNQSPRHSGTATLLKDGNVLYAGGMLDGRKTSSCELYDPVVDTWTIVDSMNTERIYHAALLLQDGSVLITGGESYTGYLKTCELFNPITKKWSQVTPLQKSRSHHVSLLLPNGQPAVLGGDLGKYDQASTRDAEIYVLQENIWLSFDDTLSPGIYSFYGSALHIYNSKYLLVNKSVWGIFDILDFKSLFYSYRNLNQKNAMIEKLSDGSIIIMGGQMFIPFGGAYNLPTTACERFFPIMTGVEESNKNQKAVISFRNHPNPFNSSTYIHYSLIKPSTIKLYVFNVKGQLVQELENGFRTPGEHHVVFDASRFPSGVYFCMLKAEHYFKIIKALKLN